MKMIALLVLSQLMTTTAFATGRTIYVPPVFSNKDFMCPVGTDQKILDFCWDFSFTNLSTNTQTVTITTRAGTSLNSNTVAALNVASDETSAALSFDGTSGQSKQAAYCVSCSSAGCNKGWSTNLSGLGGVAQAAAGAAAPNIGTNTWMYYHAEGAFMVKVAEDRGALVGRLNQRIFPSPSTQVLQCRDNWTSPQVVVELNGGRAF